MVLKDASNYTDVTYKYDLESHSFSDDIDLSSVYLVGFESYDMSKEQPDTLCHGDYKALIYGDTDK